MLVNQLFGRERKKRNSDLGCMPTMVLKYSRYSQFQATTTFNNRSCELVGASSNIPLTVSDSTKMFESGYDEKR